MSRRGLLLVLALVVAGCASKSSEIGASYVPPAAYQNFTCEQLAEEAQVVSQKAAIASGQQDKARRNDQVKTTVGLLIFWPVLLFNEGDGQKAAELASLKGQMDAIQRTATLKQCNMIFTQ